ncbi:MAG: ABC transporter ATP-binding protein [Clostridia bacterium]|nr:ABC transporter ATP-binding protein [Clostridia bacterium]
MKNKNKISKGTVKRIISYIKGYKLLFLAALLMGAVSVALSLYIPLLIGDAIDFITYKDNVQLVEIFRILITGAICVFVAAFSQWIMNIINNKITYNVIRDIRRDAFGKLERLPLGYIDTHPTGETVSRIISDVDQFADGLLMGFSQLFTGALTIIGTLAFMVTISPSITVMVVVLTPISLFVAAFIAKNTHDMFMLRAKTNAEQTAFIDETISAEGVVSAFGIKDEKQAQFDEINERFKKCSVRAIFFSSLTNPCTRFVNAIVYAAVALVGAFSVLNTDGSFGSLLPYITVGGLSTLLSYANQYTKPFNEISGVITELQNSIACIDRVFTLINEETEIPDNENAYSDIIPSGKIVFDNVSFSYTPDKKLIENLSLYVESGKKVAIVGPTGCGKTTLINLIMRFYDVNNGSISVGFDTENGETVADIRDIRRNSLRSCYGMVLQETWLKRGTVKDNILIGKPDATDEEIVTAAKAAHAHSFIKRLPNGYDTVIGEDGGSLSQGQKQLLCITRVMLCMPPMLILDEATSSIDTRTEQKIQSAFNTIMQGRTSFIVAHRLSTIRSADLILVMKDGNVIEQGTHEQLINQNGFYATLHAAGQS